MSKMKYINENIKKNLKIPDNIIKIITLINQSIFKYIKDNLNDKKIIEQKLIEINNNIKDILKKKSENCKKVQKYQKIFFKSLSKVNTLVSPEKSNNSNNKKSLKDIINNKNITNPNILGEMDSNKYLTFKLKKKLKQEHDKNKIKELEYLERIAILQCKLNLYEKNLEKLILERKTSKKIKERNNSLKNSSTSKFYFKLKNFDNNKEKEKEKDRNMLRPLSNIVDSKISNLKKYFKNFSEMYNSKKNNYIIETYISANTNTLDSYLNRNLKRNGYNSINDLHYKYQIGNNYLRNDFREIKRTIHKNNTKIEKLINYCENL